MRRPLATRQRARGPLSIGRLRYTSAIMIQAVRFWPWLVAGLLVLCGAAWITRNVARRAYYFQWLKAATAGPWGISQLVAGVLAMVSPLLGLLAKGSYPSIAERVGDLGWQVPLAIFLGSVSVAFLYAPYRIDQDRRAEIARLNARIERPFVKVSGTIVIHPPIPGSEPSWVIVDHVDIANASHEDMALELSVFVSFRDDHLRQGVESGMHLPPPWVAARMASRVTRLLGPILNVPRRTAESGYCAIPWGAEFWTDGTPLEQLPVWLQVGNKLAETLTHIDVPANAAARAIVARRKRVRAQRV